jgi:peroxidase
MQLGGPTWTVPLGRRDSTGASAALAISDLPPFTASLQELVDAFAKKGLSVTDMVALSGIDPPYMLTNHQTKQA